MNIKKILGLCIISLLAGVSFAQFEIPGNSTIYTEDPAQVLEAEDISNPLRDGAFKVINAGDNEDEHRVRNLVSSENKIETHESAKIQTLNIIKNIVNYAIGLVSLVALVYLIYHGILVLTASGDDTQYKKGLKGVKFAAIALAGIGTSRLIVSFIFYLIAGFISGF